ncbi:DNA cytosine methyltransferase [Adlercreutzia equolifaciens]|uniref:DNA cytosine methyltransferase n=1 Tax=Adlercreutzia equolifaciens TaxID=446660 RepID=UPI0022E37D91|nr:DNA cytosine methyltransferase [Adlercreutzia equolifaciens]
MTTYKTIDLFAGIGGIRLGFEQAFQKEAHTVFVSEWDKWAAQTYRENFGESPAVAGDITKIQAADVPPFDICLAGFPCQAFSFAGQRKGFEDDYKGQSRGTLFAEVVRICDFHKPKVIFCENVKGLMRHDKGRTLEIICGSFEEIGYKVFTKVLNSRHFGVPQNRERIYIVCFREDIAPENFVFPTHAGRKKVLRDILEEAPIPSKYYLSDRYMSVLRAHRARHEAAGHGFGYVIRDLDDVSGAIVCGGMGREGNLIKDSRPHSMIPTTNIKGTINSDDIRKLTPREWARLQGFPDSFSLSEADTHLYKQLGNAVSVPVISAIAKRIKAALDEG